MPDYLPKAKQIVGGDRLKDYGDTRASFTRIAQIWSANGRSFSGSTG